jgi:hypothetical protein
MMIMVWSYYNCGSRQNYSQHQNKIFTNQEKLPSLPSFPPFPSPIQNSWKALSLNVLILGRWDMGIYPFPQNFLTFIQISFFLHLLIFWVYFIFIVTGASITEEDAGFELLVAMRFTHAAIVITRQRYFLFIFFFSC